jgi:hypothetical protein
MVINMVLCSLIMVPVGALIGGFLNRLLKGGIWGILILGGIIFALFKGGVFR